MENSKGLTKSDLWDIAKFIIQKQKDSIYIDEETKSKVSWESLEDDWFNVLEEQIFDLDK